MQIVSMEPKCQPHQKRIWNDTLSWIQPVFWSLWMSNHHEESLRQDESMSQESPSYSTSGKLIATHIKIHLD